MSTLYIDRKGLGCKLENGALVFYENGERCGTVPTAPLERIVFKSDVSINTGALAKLAARGIGPGTQSSRLFFCRRSTRTLKEGAVNIS